MLGQGSNQTVVEPPQGLEIQRYAPDAEIAGEAQAIFPRNVRPVEVCRLSLAHGLRLRSGSQPLIPIFC